MSKYQPLIDYLDSLNMDQVRLSFGDIERALEFELPRSARDHSAWWANSQTKDSHSWAHLWIRSGWATRDVDLKQQQVTFQRLTLYAPDSVEANEGYARDRVVLSRIRNPGIVEERKRLDDCTCQACDFRLSIGARWVIDVHHRNPLSVTGETTTKLDDLVCLCPTCHRISHLRSEPYSVDEIKAILSGRL
jgi:predicted HNH restriction endonuclease